jgi:prepilin-type N-terminal cleavage/methylation domain-containing protein
MNARTTKHGFTLVELLVVVAILSIVITAVAATFLFSQQAASTAYQRMEIYEAVRSAFTMMDRDLSVAFAARDHGDTFTFHGTPIGMTFVGILGASNRYSLSGPLLSRDGDVGRITYAVYLGGFSEIDPQFEDPDIVLPGTGVFDDIDYERVITYSLIRYAEPGVDDLDAFLVRDRFGIPIQDFFPPDEQILQGVSRPDSTDDPFGANIWDELAGAINYPLQSKFTDVSVNSEDLTQSLDEGMLRDLLAAKKRELWVRMIAGDPTLPGFWADPNDPNDQRPRVEDYILVNDILSPGYELHDIVVRTCFADQDDVDPIFRRPMDEAANNTVQDILLGITPRTRLLPFVDVYSKDDSLLNPNLLCPQAGLPTSDGIDQLTGIDDATGNVFLRETLALLLDHLEFNGDWSVDSNPDYTYELLEWINGDPNDGLSPKLLRPLPTLQNATFFKYGYLGSDPGVVTQTSYWGSNRNFLSPADRENLELLEFSITREMKRAEALAQGGAFFRLQDALEGVQAVIAQLEIGTPATPRIPEIVNVTLPIAKEGAHRNAADFSREFTTLIEVPAGFARPSFTGYDPFASEIE